MTQNCQGDFVPASMKTAVRQRPVSLEKPGQIKEAVKAVINSDQF
jgi:hypothetical protein